MRKINTRTFRRATRTTSREINRQIALNLVREHQPISRAELARRMGVRRSAVTVLVNELLAEGLIYEGETRATPRGRKPTPLYVRTVDRLAVAVDVRFSRIDLMLCDFDGGELGRAALATPATPDELVDGLASAIGALLAEHGATGKCEGIGLVVPGMVEHRTGILLNAPALGWRDINLRPALEARVPLPVHIERDAVACALAQMWLGQRGVADGADSFVYLTVSDGIGAGLVVSGQVLRGYGDAAGEFGHVPLDLDGPLCLCGTRGCWEAFASNTATVARYLHTELSSRDAHVRVRETGVTVPDVIAAAHTGDAHALWCLRETARYLGIGLAAIINTFNPGRIIVGGELTAAWPLIAADVHHTVSRRVLTGAAAATRITVESEESNPRLRGATALVVAPVFAAPPVG